MRIAQDVIDWLRARGLEVEFADQEHPEAFVPGVWLDRGKIIINEARAHVGDVLHEAGHLACIPSCFRELVEPGSLPTPKLHEAIEQYMDTHPFMVDDMGREDPVIRGILQMGDCEATAWAYAAGEELGLPASILFDEREFGPEPYDGEGKEIWRALDARSYMGINGLQAAGFCSVRTFPKMARWLAP